MKKILIIILVFGVELSYAQAVENSQQNTVKRDYPALNSIVFSSGYGIPFVDNSLMSAWNQAIGNAAHFSIEYRKQFTKKKNINDRVVNYPSLWAMGVGVEISTLKHSATLNSISEQVNSLLDVDGDSYNAHLNYNAIQEKISLSYLDLPFYLEIGRLSKTKFKGWAKLGLKASFLLDNSFEGRGTYTSQGYYPAWDVMLYDIEKLNFNTDYSAYTDPKYTLNPFVLWGMFSAGISIPLSNYEKEIIRNTILKFGIKYDFSITPISTKSSDSMFLGSRYLINQSNILSNGTRIHRLGLEIGFIYAF